MSFVPIIIVILVFGAVFLTVQGMYWAAEIFRGQQATELSRRIGSAGALSGGSDLLLQKGGSTGEETNFRSGLDDLLLQAGNPYDLSGLMARMLGLGLTTFFVLALLSGIASDTSTLPIKLAGIVALSAVVAMLPIFQLRRLTAQRMEALTEQLPEALDLMARSLRAGHGVSESMRMVATEMTPPVSVEFGRVYEEHNLGVEFRESMDHLVERNRANFDLRIFVSSVLLQRDTGGNLIEILEQIAATIRQRFVFYGKVRTLTAESRISAIILGSIPFFVAVAIAILRPSYLTPLYTDPWGIIVSICGALWFCLGIYVLYKLTQIEV